MIDPAIEECLQLTKRDAGIPVFEDIEDLIEWDIFGRKGLPREGEILKTEKGSGKVISINALKRSVTVELEDGTWFEVVYK